MQALHNMVCERMSLGRHSGSWVKCWLKIPRNVAAFSVDRGAICISVQYCLFFDQLSDILGMIVMSHITSTRVLREHHRKYFYSSLKGYMVKHSLWIHYRRAASHQVMGLSNIKTLCILLSSKIEKASGKTILALNLVRSALYVGVF